MRYADRDRADAYLPFSQTYLHGYLATGREDFRDYFARHVQLPLAKGDAAFFNPAVFHGAGTNRSRTCAACEPAAGVLGLWPRDGERRSRRDEPELYPALKDLRAGRPEGEIANAIAACAEGYSFPTISTATRRSAASRPRPSRR